MQRRSFLKSGLASGALVTVADALSTPAVSQDRREWRLTHAYPKGYPIFGEAPQLIADYVKRASDGRLTIQVFGAGEIVPAFEAMDATESGTTEMGYGTSYFWAGKEPALKFITSMPFGLTAQEQNGWFAAGGREICQKVYDRLGVKFFVAGNSGAQMGGWFNREIDSLNDFSGLKMRIPGLGGEVIKAVGATVVNLPGGELLPAMQTGTINALEWIGPYSDLAFGFHQVAKYYYYPGWQEPSGIFDLFVNRQAWEGLPDDLKAMIETASVAANAFVLDQLAARHPAALRTLVDDHGVELRRFSDDTLTGLAKASGEVINDMASQDALSRELLDSILSFRENATAFTGVAEQAVLQARSLDYAYPKAGGG